MNGARNELYKQMRRWIRLEEELEDCKKIKLSDEDFNPLKEKAGERFVMLSIDAVRKDIKKDISHTKELINGIVCAFDFDVERALRSLAFKVANETKKCLIGEGKVSDEQMEYLKQMTAGAIEIALESIHRKLKNDVD